MMDHKEEDTHVKGMNVETGQTRTPKPKRQLTPLREDVYMLSFLKNKIYNFLKILWENKRSTKVSNI